MLPLSLKQPDGGASQSADGETPRTHATIVHARKFADLLDASREAFSSLLNATPRTQLDVLAREAALLEQQAGALQARLGANAAEATRIREANAFECPSDVSDAESDSSCLTPIKEGKVEEVRECEFYFVNVGQLRSVLQRLQRSDDNPMLPLHQELRRNWPSLLTKRKVSYAEVCAGTLVSTHLTVSHRWMSPDVPDPDGIQLGAIMTFLDSRPSVQWVWYDAWCMPQGKRTQSEEAEFSQMLANVNMLFLGTRVLLLLDLS